MPTVGSIYRLVRPEGIGNPGDPGFVRPGSQVRVREEVSADTSGAHDDTEDCVVVEVDQHFVVEDEGEMRIASAPRAFSVGVGVFSEWFEEA